MKKVNFFRSIHVKLVLIYVLLIIIALQIIGIYFSNELEDNLKSNFEESILQRIDLVQYSIREELMKERDDTNLSLEQSLSSALREFATGDINEIRVIDNRNRVLATSDTENQSIVGQRSNDDIVKKVISSETYQEEIAIDAATGTRVWVIVKPILNTIGPNSEVIGAIYIESNIEKIYDQMDDINQIFAVGTAISLVITIILGILIARTITRPIIDMRRQAQAMSRGNFSRKVRVYGDDEIGQLAVAFNHLTNRLKKLNHRQKRNEKACICLSEHDRWGYCNRSKRKGHFN